MSEAQDTRDESEQEAVEQKIINEEYKIWKKNSVFLYDVMYGRALEWPSLTTQWLPDKSPVEGTNLSQHRILLGTHTSGQAQNYIQIAHIEYPDFRYPTLSELNEERGEAGGHGNAKKPFDFRIAQRINHPGEVNKARYQPQNPEIIASSCVDGRVLIFDRTKHPLVPKSDGTIKFEAELVGHRKEGFGLSWNPLREGHLATGNEDTTVKTWDLKAGFSKNKTSLESTTTYEVHSATVNDVQYCPFHDFWIATASDDLTWKVLDTRLNASKPTVYETVAHADAVNCVAWHPEWENILATGSADKTIALWDLRFNKTKLHSLEGHKDAVMNIQWKPDDSSHLASSSNDRRICFWDLSKIGTEQTPEEMEDGPPELAFMHGGFTNRICDFDWNKNEEWCILATAEDNQMQIFRPARKIVERLEKDVNRGEVSD